jgi:hypothetical protein
MWQCPIFLHKNKSLQQGHAVFDKSWKGKFFRLTFNSNGVNNFNYIYLKDGKKKNKRDKIQPSNKTTKICFPEVVHHLEAVHPRGNL